ncbi:hypothetical protein NE237_031526 [Protea cynaroides]|uniref:Uncharacterized protein n=1 Tax=Protea cynaroides TaxID=273540 RepID=A0A9Q0L1N6_9MAGN|nr:hypothetical protein NE237_031526 [Protea cynaroides]
MLTPASSSPSADAITSNSPSIIGPPTLVVASSASSGGSKPDRCSHSDFWWLRLLIFLRSSMLRRSNPQPIRKGQITSWRSESPWQNLQEVKASIPDHMKKAIEEFKASEDLKTFVNESSTLDDFKHDLADMTFFKGIHVLELEEKTTTDEAVDQVAAAAIVDALVDPPRDEPLGRFLQPPLPRDELSGEVPTPPTGDVLDPEEMGRTLDMKGQY